MFVAVAISNHTHKAANSLIHNPLIFGVCEYGDFLIRQIERVVKLDQPFDFKNDDDAPQVSKMWKLSECDMQKLFGCECSGYIYITDWSGAYWVDMRVVFEEAKKVISLLPPLLVETKTS